MQKNLAITGLGFCLFGLSLIIAAVARGAPAPAGRQHERCFNREEIVGFLEDENKTIYVLVGSSRVYRVNLIGPCPNLNWHFRSSDYRKTRPPVSLRSRTGGGWFCPNETLDLYAPNVYAPTSYCPAHVEALGPEQSSALAARKGWRPAL